MTWINFKLILLNERSQMKICTELYHSYKILLSANQFIIESRLLVVWEWEQREELAGAVSG
jgi:hypothetical protein